MKTKLLALALLASSSILAGPRVFFGVGFGGGYYAPPPPPVPYVSYAAPYPGPGYAPGYAPGYRPGYAWINGYWYPSGPRYAWRAGYWAPRPWVGAYWSAPRYYGHRYYPGYWRR